MFVEWRMGEEYDTHGFFRQKKTGYMKIKDCVYAAAVCGAMVVKKCGDYPIYAKTASGGQGEQVATLNVHCGLGVGKMGGVHVGNDYSRRLYLVLGDPIDQVSEACDSAKLGEIWASQEALKYLNKGQPTKHKLKCDKDSKSKIIASKEQMFNTKKKMSLVGSQRTPKKPKNTFSIPFNNMNLSTLKVLRKVLSFYVHPVVVADETGSDDTDDQTSMNQTRRASIESRTRRASIPSIESSIGINGGQGRRTSITGQDESCAGNNRSLRQSRRASIACDELAIKRHESEAELRSVFTIFIKPNIDVKLSGDPTENTRTYNQLNDIMYIVTSVLENFKGQLCQFILDDKGM